MKFHIAAALALCSATHAFVAPTFASHKRASSLSMVLEMPKEKKLAKIESLKIDSDYLRHPLKEVCCW